MCRKKELKLDTTLHQWCEPWQLTVPRKLFPEKIKSGLLILILASQIPQF